MQKREKKYMKNYKSNTKWVNKKGQKKPYCVQILIKCQIPKSSLEKIKYCLSSITKYNKNYTTVKKLTYFWLVH